MKRLSQWLKFRGTRFSLARRDAVAIESHPLHAARAGMRKALMRSKRHAEGAPVSVGNSVMGPGSGAGELASVQGLHDAGHGGSGVYVVEREPGSVRPQAKTRKTMNPLLDHVTLVVYGWKNVEPGTLSWVFPSVGAAVAAARAMKNAVRWAIVAGRRGEEANDDADESSDATQDALAEARAKGAVLIEQAG